MASSECISVIIPTYFRNDGLRRAIKSVFSQSCPSIEVIIVDDSGEEHARPVASNFDVTYLPLSENCGPDVAREKGLEKATGEYIHFLDDDDQFTENALGRQVNKIESSKEIGVVYGGIKWAKETVVTPDPENKGDVLKEALSFSLFGCTTSTMLIKKEVIEKIRPLSTSYTGAEDIAMQIRLAKYSKFGFVQGPVIEAGKSEDSLGISLEAIESRKQIINDFSDEYEKFPREIKHSALSSTYQIEGRTRLRRNIWSLKAILCFAHSIRYAPVVTKNYIGELVSAIGGSPGHRVASWIKNIISS